MRIVALVLVALLGCGATAVPAQEQVPLLRPAEAPSAPASRWSFKRVDDGFVRLDNQSGQVAHCTPRKPGWACQAVPEDPAALEKQIAQLQDEIAALKKEIAQLRAAPPPPPPPPPEKEFGVSLRMPTREEIASARDYLANTVSDTWHRLVQMIAHFQRDVLSKG